MIGLLLGIFFGFCLQKSAVTYYDMILAQLLLVDFTVLKVMMSAVITGMIGFYILKSLGLAGLNTKPGSVGMTVIGGLIFGVGFGILGYCPGTMTGAVAQGNLDALFGGIVGMIIGAGIFAAIYPKLKDGILSKMEFGKITFPELFKVNPWIVVIPASIILVLFLYIIEKAGL